MRIRPSKGIRILAALLICTVPASCGSPVNREPQTDSGTAAQYEQEKADSVRTEEDTGDVSLKNMPYIEQSGYAGENGFTVYGHEINQNDKYAVEDNNIILTPMHE